MNKTGMVIAETRMDQEKLQADELTDRRTELQAETGRLAQLVERRTPEHNVSGLYRCGFESPAGQLKLLIVFRMRR